MGGITLKGEKEVFYTSESRSNNKSSTKNRYKNADKRQSHPETANPRELGKMTTKVLKGNFLKAFTIIAERTVTSLRIADLKKTINDEWNEEVLCDLEEDRASTHDDGGRTYLDH